MNWNWDHIRFFLALAEHHTLTSAAQHLDVSHSTVLRRINQFEKDLNTRLFEQSSNGYQMTRVGKELFNECTAVNQRLQTALQQASGADQRLAGEIVITTSDSLAQYLLPTALRSIQSAHSNLRFNLQMTNRVSNLDDREADIAVRPCKAPPEHLIGRKVGKLSFCAVASKCYLSANKRGIGTSKTGKHKFILLNESYSSMPFYQLFLEQIHNKASCTTVSNFTNAAAMARAGMGITILPKYILQHEPELVEAPLAIDIPSNDLWILSHTDLRNTDRIKLVKKLLYNELQACLSHN